MPMTLIEASKLRTNTTIQTAVIEMFAKQSPLMSLIPFDNIEGNAYGYSREVELPGVAFRGVNETYTESSGVINPLTESLYIMGGDLDVDKFIVRTQGPRARATHVGMKIKALADSWSVKFIKGDNATDPREFDGLQVRLTGSQLIDQGSTSGGDVATLSKLDEAIDACDNANVIVMNRTLARRMSRAARDSSVAGDVTYTLDGLGRRVVNYAGLPIVTVGNGSTEPLGFTEACPGGGSAVGTSIYVLALGAGMLKGIQNAPLEAVDLGEIDSAPVYRTRIEWYAGIALEHGRAAVRLRGIKDGAWTA